MTTAPLADPLLVNTRMSAGKPLTQPLIAQGSCNMATILLCWCITTVAVVQFNCSRANDMVFSDEHWP